MTQVTFLTIICKSGRWWRRAFPVRSCAILIGRMSSDWRSYDSAAETHENIAVPYVFLRPAQDLVAAMQLAPGARVLDAGCGTGVAARVVNDAVAPGGLVVALDPAVEMLRVGRRRGLAAVVCGEAQTLPFPDAAFDAVVASFVISHVPAYQAALSELVRVLRPGGKLGMTAWGPAEDRFRQHWRTVAESFGAAGSLEMAVPWEEWLADPANLREALTGAGLTAVEIETREYPSTIPIADFLASREQSVQARFLRRHLDSAEWERFRRTLAEEFRRFDDPIENRRDAHLAIGRKPPLSATFHPIV
jgi:SAM-dependent methyltransferase